MKALSEETILRYYSDLVRARRGHPEQLTASHIRKMNDITLKMLLLIDDVVNANIDEFVLSDIDAGVKNILESVSIDVDTEAKATNKQAEAKAL